MLNKTYLANYGGKVTLHAALFVPNCVLPKKICATYSRIISNTEEIRANKKNNLRRPFKKKHQQNN